ncbi:ORF4 [Turkey adenovirus 3]|uniref:Uncharacterized protein n=1 Tax=Turkey adenovirus 3 TaxID=41678 RepID=Q9YUR8_9ADEN|nr:hypothetical protein TaV3gp04 [Turkey adenovirus 3]AAC64542.1 ORF4 [Turkey adenovirus 3]
MPFFYLVGAGSAYCERCKEVCEKRRKRSTTRTTRTKRSKPSHLQYVRYYPGTVVPVGWDGTDKPVTVTRIPDYWTYDRAVSSRQSNTVVPVNTSGENPTVVAVPRLLRKRKASDM